MTALIRAGHQADFLFQVDGVPADKLRVAGFKGREALSNLFFFTIEIASTDRNIDFSKVVGKNGLLTIAGKGGKRFVHGVVSRFEELEYDEKFTTYEADLVPSAWLLSRRSKSRIFQAMTVPDIVKKVLQEGGIASDRMEWVVKAEYPKRNYCVQYRETDLAFVSRLMEEEGIFYWFRHTKDGHVLVVADQNDAATPLALGDRFPFIPPTGMVDPKEHVQTFRFSQQVRPGKSTLRDYNHQKPALSLESAAAADVEENLEVYDYPGIYTDPDGGKRLAKLRLEAMRATRALGVGTGTGRGFQPGFRMTLEDHGRSDFNQEYLLVRVQHAGNQPEAREREMGKDESAPYTNTFDVIPVKVPYRAEHRTPRPIVHGAQTAVVVGPKGEEIYTDEQGRVKVQFHWDREGEFDEKSSCWIRVSQKAAGTRYGSVIIPRIGWEVVVSFLEGDPDRPLITGCVYNAANEAPYALPDEKTKAAFKTSSSPGADGFNELRFEDKKGEEQVFMHAEKDLDLRVKNDRRELIGHDRSLIVKRDRLDQIERDVHVVVRRDKVEEIGRDRHHVVKGKEAIEIAGSKSLTVKGDVIEVFKGNHSEQVTSNLYVKGMNVVIEGMTGLTVKVGGSFITLNAAGVFIKGSMVMINSGGAALSGSAGNAVAPIAPAAAIEADKAEPGSKPEARSGQPTHDSTSEDNKEKIAWLEIELKDESGKPVAGEPFQVTLPDGKTIEEGTLDEKGFARIGNIDPGTCKITFPRLDKDAWDKA